LAESKIQYPDQPNMWHYRVSVPYMKQRINVPARMLVEIGMLVEPASKDPDWNICFDSSPAEDNQEIMGSYRLPNSGTTYFQFQKTDSHVATYRLMMQMEPTKPESRLVYSVPRHARLTSGYVRDAIRKLLGFRDGIAD